MLRGQAAQGLMLIRPPEEAPMLRGLMEALGDQFIDAPQRAFGVTMMTERSAATAATDDRIDDRIAKLEDQITKLREQIDKLTPGAPG